MTGGGCDWITGCDVPPGEVGWFLTRYRNGRDRPHGRLRRLCPRHARLREVREGDSVTPLSEGEVAIQVVMRR